MGVLGIDPSRVETNGAVPDGLGRYPVGAATKRVNEGGDGGKVTTGLGRYPVGAATKQTQLQENEATIENKAEAGARSARNLLGDVVNNARCVGREVVVNN